MQSGRQPPEFRFRLRMDGAGGAHTPETVIDMTPDGGMLPPPRARLSWPTRIGIGAVIVAVIAGLAAAAAVFLWLASVLIPIALLAALIAYVALRIQLWRRGV